MHQMESASIVIIVIAVLLFFLLGIAILMLVDHKARLPGHFTQDQFSIKGMRRNHPGISFITTIILFSIIFTLLMELGVTFYGKFSPLPEQESPGLLTQIGQERSAEKLRHFHNTTEKLLPTQGNKTVCFQCHGDYPHSKEPMIRTILNMHTQFVGCMTCHNDARKVNEQSLTFNWLNFSGIKTSGPPFGTSIDPETGNLIETDDYYSKIVVYSNNKLLEITPDTPDTIEFIKINHQLTDEDRQAIKERFHRLVSPKGRFCSRCHTQENGYIPFAELGFSERRRNDLTNLNIIGLVEKYKDFYIPNLLNTDKSIPSLEDLTRGPEKSKASKDHDIKSPWWEKK